MCVFAFPLDYMLEVIYQCGLLKHSLNDEIISFVWQANAALNISFAIWKILDFKVYHETIQHFCACFFFVLITQALVSALMCTLQLPRR